MPDGDKRSRLSADDAFAALGNETRVRILRELGDAGEPLAFSTLYDRLELTDFSQFNYHLETLLGHFVHKLDGEYALARPGERVVEAIRSGTVTGDPELERTPVESRCSDCDGELSIQWRNGSIELFCGTCESRWDRSWGRVGSPDDAASGYLGRLPFPPAGLRNRAPSEVLRAAHVWSTLELVAVSAGLCPRCSATVDRELRVCPDHDDADGPCPACHSSFEVRLVADCTNCIATFGAGAVSGLLTAPALYAFLFEQGLNPLAPEDVDAIDGVLNDYEETVHSTEPLRAEFTLSAGGEELTLLVDDSLAVVEHSR